jgi:hypothetical protein
MVLLAEFISTVEHESMAGIDPGVCAAETGLAPIAEACRSLEQPPTPDLVWRLQKALLLRQS